MAQEIEQVQIGPSELITAMTVGGRADVTVRSKKSGQHVRVSLSAKKRADGGGFISRAKTAGRVGIADADTVFANDPLVEFGDSGLAKWLVTGKHAGKTFVDTKDQNRGWIARMLLQVLTGDRTEFPESAEVFLATRCCICAKKLEDPQSIERGIGPECFGKATASKSLPANAPSAPAPAPAPEPETMAKAAAHAKLDTAIDVGYPPALMIDGIREDETLDDETKAELVARCEALIEPKPETPAPGLLTQLAMQIEKTAPEPVAPAPDCHCGGTGIEEEKLIGYADDDEGGEWPIYKNYYCDCPIGRALDPKVKA